MSLFLHSPGILCIKKVLFFIVGFFIFFPSLFSQYTLQGTVTDNRNQKPIAFVSIVEKGKQNGTSTDIDGKITLPVKTLPLVIQLSCIGYEPKEVEVNSLNFRSLKVVLEPTAYLMNEMKFVARENPANPIIRKVMQRRDTLNPDHLGSYTYNTYNKTLFTGRTDTIINPLAGLFGNNDSLNKATDSLFMRQHLFINESVTQKKYKKPDQRKETIIASRTSGLENPIFSTLTTQLQSFSFYENQNFKILNTSYINPLADGSFSYYYYQIEDTAFSGTDTVFIISFQPKKGRKFEGLQGRLYINKTYYALENATASPVTTDQMQLTIIQQYQRLDSIHWFPVQLNTDILLNNIKVGKYKIVVEARTYIKDIVLNPPLKNNEFGAIEVDVDKNAVKDQEKILPLFRQSELDKKDSVTYTTIDSLGKKIKIEKRLEFAEALLDGKIRISIFDIPIDKIFNYNNYEGIRLGIGLETNRRLLKWMSLGGYVAYGFKDQAVKYGGFVEFLPHRRTDLRIRFDYKQDVLTSGFTDFPIRGPVMLSNVTNQIFLNVFDSVRLFEGSISVKPFQNWQLRFAMNHQSVDPTLPYRFLPDTNANQHYNFTEIELTSRWAIKEKYIMLGYRYIAKPTLYPIFHFHITQSLPGLGGEFSYTKLMARITQTFYWRKLGKTILQAEGGYIFGDAPYTKLFANRGSFAGFSIVTRHSFETMRANEFMMDSYFAFYFAHNFGTLFRVKKFMRPEISIVHNLGIGWMRDEERHTGIPFKTMKHGFFEGGIVLDNIIVISNSGFGIGVFHRYGAYADSDPLKNFYFKLALSTVF